ncbi:MAG: helix-turn-helix transcriptional regulator [Acidithiobacillus sp.]|nr:helix-turn-helix transcriptional regulator [Acidithiobacillus sp.]
MSDIILQIKEALDKRGVSQSWLAERVGIGQKTMNNWLAGRTQKVGYEVIKKAQDVLGISEESGSILKIKELPPSKQIAVDIIVNAMSEDEALDFVLNQREQAKKKAGQPPA